MSWSSAPLAAVIIYIDLVIWVISNALYKGKNNLRLCLLDIMTKGITCIVFLFFSSLSRVLEPSVLMEMKLSDGKIHTFEVRHWLGEINMSVGGKALVNSSCGCSCNLQYSSKFKNYQSYNQDLSQQCTWVLIILWGPMQSEEMSEKKGVLASLAMSLYQQSRLSDLFFRVATVQASGTN